MGIPFSLPISRRDKKKQIHNYQRVIMSVLGSKTLQLTRKATTTIIPRRSMHVNTGYSGFVFAFRHGKSHQMHVRIRTLRRIRLFHAFPHGEASVEEEVWSLRSISLSPWISSLPLFEVSPIRKMASLEDMHTHTSSDSRERVENGIDLFFVFREVYLS